MVSFIEETSMKMHARVEPYSAKRKRLLEQLELKLKELEKIVTEVKKVE